MFGTKFVKCDTTHWEDQLEMFRTAASFSDDGRISYVVANAGIARAGDVFSFSGTCHHPKCTCTPRKNIFTDALQATTRSLPSPTSASQM